MAQSLSEVNNLATQLSRQIDSLQRTMAQTSQSRPSGVSGISDVSGEPKYLTRDQLIELRSKIVEFRQAVVERDETIAQLKNVINEMKKRTESELLSIKKDLLVSAATLTPKDFRDTVAQYLLQIKDEISKNCTKSSNASQNS